MNFFSNNVSDMKKLNPLRIDENLQKNKSNVNF